METSIDGIAFGELGGEEPVQGFGTLDGEPFYFRGGAEQASLAVGGDDPADVPRCRVETQIDRAGQLKGTRLVRVFEALVAEVRRDDHTSA